MQDKSNTKPLKMSHKYISAILIAFIVCLSMTSAFASNNLVWEEDKRLRSYNYRDATTNEKGLYLVVGDDGMIKTSKDLVNWDFHDAGTNQYLYGCAYGNDTFVAVGSNGTIIYSQDGNRWIQAEVDQTIDFEDVTWGNGKFYAVGCIYGLTGQNDPRFIFSSTDGTEWTKVFENKGEFNWSKIKYINDTIVAMGLWDNIAFSKDGVDWTVKDIGDDHINDIIWDGNKYAAVGSKSKIYTSSNLSDWTSIKNNFNGEYFIGKIVKFKNQYFVVVSNNGSNVLLSSSDLSTWALASDEGYNEISSFIVSNDKLIAFGWKQTVLQTSDGVNWNTITKSAPNLIKAIWNGVNYLAIDTNGGVLLSQNGLDWKAHNTSIQRILVDIIWTGKNYTALGITYGTNDDQYHIVETEVYQSLDGINWNSKSVLGRKNIERIFYLNNKYFLVGRKGEILISEDAVDWIETKSGTDEWLRGMAWNGSRYICVGAGGTILTSTDGSVWSKQNAYTLNELNSVIWNGTQFVAVGSWKTIVVSTDGLKWQARAEKDSTSFEEIIWDGKNFIVLPNVGEIYKSEDGRTWIKDTQATSGLGRSIAWNGYRYIVVGSNGTIVSAVPKDFVKVLVDGNPVIFDVAPISKDGRNLVPLRAIFNALGAEVEWNDTTKTITATKGDITITLKAESNIASVNGVSKVLDVSATSYNGRTMVPARFIAESLGANVEWDGVTQTILITTKK